jgi:two-component SAPR family response regulator
MFVSKCLIFEESKDDILLLTDYINKETLCEIVVADTIDKAMSLLKMGVFDLFIININNPLMLNLIKKNANLPPTIIISSTTDYAADAFDINDVVDYLVKPILIPRLQKSVSRAFKRNTNSIK